MITYTITAPDDTVTNGVLDLGAITLAMAGNYVFTSDVGCSETLNIIVTGLFSVNLSRYCGPKLRIEIVGRIVC